MIRGRQATACLTVALISLSACASGVIEPVLPPLEIVVSGGSDQYGTAQQVLPSPLKVVVRAVATQAPQAGVSVQWTIVVGNASFVGATTAVTDSVGMSEVRLRLGSTTGQITVRATVLQQMTATATLNVYAVGLPTLTGLSDSRAAAGVAITLSGTNFSPVADQNIVLFSGIRGRVTTASPTQLTVTVPSCLPTRDVNVSVQLGAVASGSLPLTVIGGSELTDLAVGSYVDVDDEAGYTCLRLPGGTGSEYVAVLYSASTIGAATYPFELTGLADLGAQMRTPPSARAVPEAGRGRPAPDLQGAFDARLRLLEDSLAYRGRAVTGPGLGVSALAPAAAPMVGERRTFKVYAGPGTFADVQATARFVGAHAALFVDDSAPAGGLTDANLEQLSDRFDDVIQPTVTDLFGAASDLDGNERVVVLFTPTVNRLTPPSSTSYIGGFFYGLDLLADRENSNGGEIFYALVPDPTGAFGPAHSTRDLLEDLPAILAHEFQHMVHFNRRVIQLGAPSSEALWLSEALAQLAEEKVALAYEAIGASTSAALFRRGNRGRARLYLEEPEAVSLIIASGRGTLEERGAGFLYLLYLESRYGSDILADLTATTLTGVANIEAQTGAPWQGSLADWWSAVILDGSAPEPGALAYASVDLRGFLGVPFPLVPDARGPDDLMEEGALWSAAVKYYLLSPSPGGSMSIRLGAAAGGGFSPESLVRMRVVRVQ